MLTKEECLKALDMLNDGRGHESFNGGYLNTYGAISCLINEHFELKEELKTGELSDGYHTFNELYHHRAILFSVICNQNKEVAWKSKKHSDESMFDGMFIVGITTPKGNYTYHYDIEPYWDMFDVKELENAPKWDGHEPKDIDRLFSIVESSLSRVSTQEDSNPPLKFEELKEGMWLWDNKHKVYNKIDVISTFNGTIESLSFRYLNETTQWGYLIKFEENRFYRREVLGNES